MQPTFLLSHLKNLADADIVGPIAAQHCFLRMRCPAYRMVHQSACARGRLYVARLGRRFNRAEISGLMRN
jgi:hypothetical protein